MAQSTELEVSKYNYKTKQNKKNRNIEIKQRVWSFITKSSWQNCHNDFCRINYNNGILISKLLSVSEITEEKKKNKKGEILHWNCMLALKWMER